MRINGHNEQCTCVECASPNQVAMPLYTPTEAEQQAELDRIDRKFDPPLQGGTVWGVPETVGVRAELPLSRHMMGSRIVGAVELDHVAPTGRIVAVVVEVDGASARWALWWDRTANELVARPMRKQDV